MKLHKKKYLWQNIVAAYMIQHKVFTISAKLTIFAVLFTGTLATSSLTTKFH